MTTRIIGVRHHSPACARRVQQAIDEVKPDWVLIEGPANFNGRIEELALDHTPPIAAFEFYFDGDRRFASYYPFCEHSPEWIAARLGLERGASVRFIDLPGFAVRDDAPVENRYADRGREPEYMADLERALGEYGYDAVWDACFELSEDAELETRLETYFDGIREAVPASSSDEQREAFMGDYVAWADGQPGDVVVVCGGFHAPVLARSASRSVEHEPSPPPPADGSRAATWLVPFSEPRLDSFQGYASGLPSPAWYRWSYCGANPARCALEATAQRLRDRGLNISVADTIAAFTQAEMLARVRGHSSIARVDLLDAVVSTWVKDALEAPLPWAVRQTLPAGTHPVIVELLAALSGDKRGRLAEATPLPPLVAHVEALLQRLDLEPDAVQTRTVELYPGEAETEPRRVALERLMLLAIAGFQRASDSDASPQRYAIFDHPEFAATVAEAASYGPTLEAAAIAALEERAAQASSVDDLTEVLVSAIRARLPTLSRRALDQLSALIAQEKDLGLLGAALRRMLSILRHAGVDPADRAAIVTLISSAVDRGLWLVEGIRGSSTRSLGRVAAVAALRDAMLNEKDAIDVPVERMMQVWRRVAEAVDVPADLRGAALGAEFSQGFITVADASKVAVKAFETATPSHLGDYLIGLLTLARELLSTDNTLATGLDHAIKGLTSTDFMVALPALRQAFQQLPARERAAFAERVTELHGGSVSSLLAPQAAPVADVARARAVEDRVNTTLREVGLDE